MTQPKKAVPDPVNAALTALDEAITAAKDKRTALDAANTAVAIAAENLSQQQQTADAALNDVAQANATIGEKANVLTAAVTEWINA